jgi:hypothetical protein
MGLLLEAVDVGGPLTWRWLLRDADSGNPLADQPVRLDPESDDVVRFRDLYGYLDAYAAPDRWTEDGTRFVGLAGKWAGRELLGEAVASAAAGDLGNLVIAAGRLAEALAVAGQQVEFTGRAGLGPWTRLADRAGRLLAECQRVFEDYADTPMLARILSARASLEDALGHWQVAADLGQAALRLSYAWPEPADIAASHNNLANYLGELDGDRAGQRAHRLAAALTRQLSGMAHELATTVRALAAELRDGDPPAGLPATVAHVVATAELTERVRLGALLAALQSDPQAVEDALAGILRAVAAPETPVRPAEEQ